MPRGLCRLSWPRQVDRHLFLLLRHRESSGKSRLRSAHEDFATLNAEPRDLGDDLRDSRLHTAVQPVLKAEAVEAGRV